MDRNKNMEIRSTAILAHWFAGVFSFALGLAMPSWMMIVIGCACWFVASAALVTDE